MHGLLGVLLANPIAAVATLAFLAAALLYLTASARLDEAEDTRRGARARPRHASARSRENTTSW